MRSRRSRKVSGFLALVLCLLVVAADRPDRAPTYRELKTLLTRAVVSGDDERIQAVLEKFSVQPGRQPTRVVIEVAAALPAKEENLFWFLIDGVTSFNRPGAFSEMGDFVVQYRKSALAREILHGLQKNRSKYVNRVLRRVFDRCG